MAKKASGEKKSSAPAAKTAKKPPKVKDATRVLRAEDRVRLLKPTVEDPDELATTSADTWKKYTKIVHVVGLSPAKLKAKFAKAKKARKKEEVAQKALDKRKDARMLLEDDAWRGLLNLRASVDNVARQRPDVLGAFEDLMALFKKKGAGKKPGKEGAGAAPESPKPEPPSAPLA